MTLFMPVRLRSFNGLGKPRAEQEQEWRKGAAKWGLTSANDRARLG
jgi:hypothetical protein